MAWVKKCVLGYEKWTMLKNMACNEKWPGLGKLPHSATELSLCHQQWSVLQNIACAPKVAFVEKVACTIKITCAKNRL